MGDEIFQNFRTQDDFVTFHDSARSKELTVRKVFNKAAPRLRSAGRVPFVCRSKSDSEKRYLVRQCERFSKTLSQKKQKSLSHSNGVFHKQIWG